MLSAHSAAATDAAGNPIAAPAGPNTLMGRLSGTLRGLSYSEVMTLLQAIVSSVGASSAGRLVKTDATGKLDESLIPPTALGGTDSVSVSVAEGQTDPPGGAGSIFRGTNGDTDEFRGIVTETPETVEIKELNNDVAVNVKPNDNGTGPKDLWSAQEIIARFQNLVNWVQSLNFGHLIDDPNPGLGGDLDLNGFALVQNGQDILSVEDAKLFLMGLEAIRGVITNVQEGDTIRWRGAEGGFVNEPLPGTSGGSAPPTQDIVGVVATSDKPIVQNTAGRMKLQSDLHISPNWVHDGISGSSFDLLKYVGTGPMMVRVRATWSGQNSVENESAAVRIRMVHLDSIGAIAYRAGTSHTAEFGYKATLTAEAIFEIDTDESIGLEVLHENGGAASVVSKADGCSIQVIEILRGVA
ncbi:MAG: hypothetical protein R3F33_11055 [Planctomycetota bacterium]